MAFIAVLAVLGAIALWLLMHREMPPAIQAPPPRSPVRVTVVESRVPVVEEELKMNANEIEAHLKAYGVKRLYHFTDRANLDSIIRHGGLYSWHYCFQSGIEIPRIGSTETSRMLDASKGLQDFVRLSFTRSHPMMHVAMKDGRIVDPVVLEIDLSVALAEKTLFSDVNAAKHGANFGGDLQALRAVRLDICAGRHRYFDLPTELKPYYQAEVMVRTFIPLERILNLKEVA